MIANLNICILTKIYFLILLIFIQLNLDLHISNLFYTIKYLKANAKSTQNLNFFIKCKLNKKKCARFVISLLLTLFEIS